MEYRVLARKYRPANFDDLIGQDVLVRTLSNAIKSGRIAHAFLLTGIRGVGKTTTARIIARALNCEKGPTINPCGVCSNCAMINEDRHVDVIEMDAASHTGVGDIRDLIDTVRYLPTSARYKIYIIDEVHMLSTSAFNALLKTLEEPPPHVKFIFATTEARKIPVTILSRCQRFDLKRIDMDTLGGHLAKIAGKENVAVDTEALSLIAVAAEGSVRDALSLLDQAIARGGEEGASITAAEVRRMIGAADNTATFRLLDLLLKGDVPEALAAAQRQYEAGGDPLLMVQDALEVTHLVTRVKVAANALYDVALSESDRTRAKDMAEKLSMASLARLWQMLLKGLSELKQAPAPFAALEMLLVRIAYSASLPTPAEAIRNSSAEKNPHPNPLPVREREVTTPGVVTGEGISSPAKVSVDSFADAVALFAQHREPLLYSHLTQHVRLVSFTPGRIEIRPTMTLPREVLSRIGECLSRWTGQAWKVTLSEEEGAPTLQEAENTRKQQVLETATAHPLVANVLEQFPGAKVVGVKENA